MSAQNADPAHPSFRSGGRAPGHPAVRWLLAAYVVAQVTVGALFVPCVEPSKPKVVLAPAAKAPL
ncbi:hypothetical protein Afe04nite_33700 [Asanoa ferruginea]|nr:hypothetical protein Afe04nite_33700 [Asanoa ferruginea]